MKNVFILLLVVFVNNIASSQDEIKKGIGDKFYYNSKTYKAKELKGILEQEEEAFSIYQIAKRRKSSADALGISSLVLGITGGSLLHIGIKNSRGEGFAYKPIFIGFGMMSVSSCLVFFGIWNSILRRKKVREAVDVFNRNNKIPKIGSLERTIDIKFSGSGLGVKMSF